MSCSYRIESSKWVGSLGIRSSSADAKQEAVKETETQDWQIRQSPTSIGRYDERNGEGRAKLVNTLGNMKYQ